MRETIRNKLLLRLIAPLTFLTFLNSLDRVNVSFAALKMNADLGLTPERFGFGVGLFFVGYLACQFPHTASLRRFGARRWIFVILLLWGALSASNAFVKGPYSFYTVRVLLGLVEAGFYPGMILYLTYWFPRPYRGRLVAIFMAALPAANIVGGPLSSLSLGMSGYHGLAGWQWLFLIEGAPSILLAFAVLMILPDGPGSGLAVTPSTPRPSDAADAHTDRTASARSSGDLTTPPGPTRTLPTSTDALSHSCSLR